MNSDKKNRGIIVFLLLSLIATGILSFQNARDYSKLQSAFIEEKEELQLELDKIITDYDRAITKKIDVSSQLRKERNKIVQFRDSINNLKEQNYSLIRKYRKRIAKLEEQNRALFVKVDSLNKANKNLLVENSNVRGELDKKEKLSNELAEKNQFLEDNQKELETKVAIAKELEVSDLMVIPLKQRSNGKYTSTSRSRKVEAFKISFDILRNEVAEKGNRKVYVQVLDTDRNIISADGHIILKNGKRLIYSDVFSASYYNQEMSLVNLVKVKKGQIKKGSYLVSVFIEGTLMDRRIVELK